MKTGNQRAMTMFSLLFAGEAVFSLPFHVARYFRPTYVEVLGITQTQLGDLGAIYGIVAMFAYLLGGSLADRFAARKLLVFALVSTAVSGFFLATIPTLSQLRWLYAFWGASTILPFWSALMRATREWGGPQEQGKAFGILDGGRGVIAAVMATAALWMLSTLLSTQDEVVTAAQRTTALRGTIYFYTGATLLAAVCVWWFVPEPKVPAPERQQGSSGGTIARLIQVGGRPLVWLHALVIMAAYSAYRGSDFFSQFAHDVWGWSEVESARLSTTAVWIRPIAAVGAGLLADRWSSSRVIMGAFLLTGAGYAVLPWIGPNQALGWLLWMSVFTVCVGMFSLRGIYFALLEEIQIPRMMTGTVVGVVSFIGYIPDIFIPYSGGRLIDHWSGGPTGYNVFYVLLACGCGIGMIAAWLLGICCFGNRDASDE